MANINPDVFCLLTLDGKEKIKCAEEILHACVMATSHETANNQRDNIQLGVKYPTVPLEEISYLYDKDNEYFAIEVLVACAYELIATSMLSEVKEVHDFDRPAGSDE